MPDTVDVTGVRPADDAARRHFSRLRYGLYGTRTVLLLALLAGAVVAWFGDRSAPLPTAGSDTAAEVPFWRVITAFAGALPSVALHSPMADLESMGTARFQRSRAWRFALLWGASSSLFLLTAGVVEERDVLLSMAAALPGWTGLALLCGRVVGWRQAWLLPGLLLCAVTYWSVRDAQGNYPWWDFTLVAFGADARGVVTALGLLLVGLTACWLTAWRRRALRGVTRRGFRRPGGP